MAFHCCLWRKDINQETVDSAVTASSVPLKFMAVTNVISRLKTQNTTHVCSPPYRQVEIEDILSGRGKGRGPLALGPRAGAGTMRLVGQLGKMNRRLKEFRKMHFFTQSSSHIDYIKTFPFRLIAVSNATLKE